MMNYIYTLIPIALIGFAAVQGSKWNFNAATYMDKKYTNAVKGMMCVVIMYVHIAITPCAAEHPMSFKVPDRLLTDGQCRMMINGIQFIQVLLEANGLAAGKDHQFKGRYDAEKNAVIISLEKDEQSALSPQKCTT